MFCSTGAANLKTYATEFRDVILGLGCGEKTDSQDLLPRSYRVPRVDDEFPYSLTTRLLKDLLVNHKEVADVAYGARWATGTTTTITAPTLPATTLDKPKILVLKHLAFRRIV
jgi:hypothetical protein